MAQKHEGRITIRGMASQAGLATAGHQAGIPETMLWDATNFVGDIDGLLTKAPGLRQYGQVIYRPDRSVADDPVTIFSSFIDGIGDYATVDGSSGEIEVTASRGVLQTNVTAGTGAGNETYSASAIVDTLSANTTWSFRVAMQGVNLSAYNGTDTDPYTLAFRVRADATSGKEFALYSGGLYYKQVTTGIYVLVTGSAFAGIGGWNVFEIRGDSTGSVYVYMNDVLLETLTASNMYQASFVDASAEFEFAWQTNGSAQYTTRIATPMYNDVDEDAFATDSIVNLIEYQYYTRSGTRKKALLAAAGPYIYHDTDLLGVWRPLTTKAYPYVFFAPYRRYMAWVEHNGGASSRLWLWDGTTNTPEEQDDAPTMHAIAEHQQRLTGVGDPYNPYRWYYSGVNQPNVWYSPGPDNIGEQYDTAYDAGYLEIPARDGDYLTALSGDYYGNAVVWTRRNVWRIFGYGSFSYGYANIQQGDGCTGSEAWAPVGNDIWYHSPNGIRSLQTTDQYGDIVSQHPAGVIHNLWTITGASNYLVNKPADGTVLLRYSPSQNLVYIGLPLRGNSSPMHVYAYNVGTNQAYGPWTYDTLALRNVELDNEVMLHGSTTGTIGQTYYSRKLDVDGSQLSSILQSAILTGRSIDPVLDMYQKDWRELRLMILPRGAWDFDVSWYASNNDANPSLGSETHNQGETYRAYGLGNADGTAGDFRLDHKPDSLLRGGQDIIVVKIPLDQRGYGLWWKLETDYDFTLHSWEVDCVPVGYEVE